MGVFSKLHRFREAGQQANVNNVERFGEPARSLFTTTKVFSFRQHTDITDENGEICYQSVSKVISLHDKTDIVDRAGETVAHIERKVFSIHERHFVTVIGGTDFEVSTELWHLVKDIMNINGLGWQLQGNVLGLNFELYDSDGSIVAVIGQKMLSLHDKYCIDIYKPEYEREIVALLITLQHMIRDREAAESTTFSDNSSDN